MSGRSKIYVVSDMHLGLDLELTSLEREEKLVRWMDTIKADAKKLILLGDSFDYWFEYKNCVPKGHEHFISKLSELAKAGVEIDMFTGNHDMWLFDYFKTKVGARIITDPMEYDINGDKYFIGHGDGLGPGDLSYKFIKYIFRNKICQWLFARLHPNTGIAIMRYFSKKSRDAQVPEPFDAITERQVAFAEAEIKKTKIDYFIFGHRHLPINYTLSNKQSILLNTGDWIRHFSYLEIDQNGPSLKFFNSENEIIYGN